jgi:hypothetical protein
MLNLQTLPKRGGMTRPESLILWILFNNCMLSRGGLSTVICAVFHFSAAAAAGAESPVDLPAQT